jgi:Fe-S-cluster-containing hydrogenase component 2
MDIEVNFTLCDECATCISVCPADAIVLDGRIAIDKDKCISCGNCMTVCPMGALADKRNAPASQGGLSQ